MKNINVSPEQMDVIINCQMLKSKTVPNYDKFKDFNNLAVLTIEELRDLQEELIPEYNKIIESGECLPPTMLYRKYLNIASIRFNMQMDEARNKYGLFTVNQWLKLFNENPR